MKTNFNDFINESKKPIDYEKKFGKRIAEVNEIIDKAKKDYISGIEVDSTYEQVYDFDKVELTKTKFKVHYKLPYDNNKKVVDDVSLAKDRENDFEEVKYLLSWVKKCIKKGYREEGKEQEKERKEELKRDKEIQKELEKEKNNKK